MTATSAGDSHLSEVVARAPLLLLVSVFAMFGLVVIEPEGLATMFLSVGCLAISAVLSPPRPKDLSLSHWPWLIQRGVVLGTAMGATWLLLSQLRHPFTLALYGTSYGYFLFRIVELLDEGPDSLCHLQGAAWVRIVFVLWLADVRTLHTVPDDTMRTTWALVGAATRHMVASALCVALLQVPWVPAMLAVYILMGSFAFGMLAVDYCYQLPVHLIWNGRLAIGPCMTAPWRAASLREFWGQRYNRTFHGLLHRYIYKPLCCTLGQGGAALAAFAVSGLLHAWPMLLVGLPFWAFVLTLAFFLVHGLLVASEAQGLYGCSHGCTIALLMLTWPLVGCPLLRVVRP